MQWILKLEESRKEVEAQLLSALEAESFPQSILLEGIEGIGKRKLAMELALMLSCKSEEKKPCGQCFSCKAYKPSEGEAPFHWILPVDEPAAKLSTLDKRIDAQVKLQKVFMADPYVTGLVGPKHRIGVEFIRDLMKTLSYKESQTRVVIIPFAEKMDARAANAFLKTLEEVPENIYFILTTSSRSSLLPTILSRCLRISVLPHSYKEAQEHIQDEQLASFFQMADGSLGKVRWLLEGNQEATFQKALDFLTLRQDKDAKVLDFIETDKIFLEASGAVEFLDALYLLMGDLQLLHNKQTVRSLALFEGLQKVSLPVADPELWNSWLAKVSEAKARIKGNCRPKIAIGAMALQMK